LRDGAISGAARQKALEAMLAVGFRKLAVTGTFQRPEVVFCNDGVLSASFNNEQRVALQQAALALGAAGVRFE
jgi:hypothetical protein